MLALSHSPCLKIHRKEFSRKEKKVSVLRKTILMKTIIVPRKENLSTVPSLLEVLSELQITPQDNYDALSISNDSGFQIHLKRQPNEYFINNYFAEGLKAWKADIDIQPDFNHYKAITYMCRYFSRIENETLEAMKQAAKEAHALGKTNLEKMRTVARASSTYEKEMFGSKGSMSSNVRVVA